MGEPAQDVAVRSAVVTVSTVRIECPHCGSELENEEGNGHNGCVCAASGETKCEDCGGMGVIDRKKAKQ